MDKIEEIRNIVCRKSVHYSIPDFHDGFDAAMELQLDAVQKFMEWLPRNYHVSQYYEWIDDKTHSELNGIDIYKHFIENIYQPKP